MFVDVRPEPPEGGTTYLRSGTGSGDPVALGEGLLWQSGDEELGAGGGFAVLGTVAEEFAGGGG